MILILTTLTCRRVVFDVTAGAFSCWNCRRQLPEVLAAHLKALKKQRVQTLVQVLVLGLALALVLVLVFVLAAPLLLAAQPRRQCHWLRRQLLSLLLQSGRQSQHQLQRLRWNHRRFCFLQSGQTGWCPPRPRCGAWPPTPSAGSVTIRSWHNCKASFAVAIVGRRGKGLFRTARFLGFWLCVVLNAGAIFACFARCATARQRKFADLTYLAACTCFLFWTLPLSLRCVAASRFRMVCLMCRIVVGL